MQQQETASTTAPPRLIPSFMAGFNSVAGNIRLILLPVLLDLVLWFAPRVSVKALLEPMLNRYLSMFAGTGSKEVQAIIANGQVLWQEVLGRFNLLDSLRTLPIGVPSLLSGRGIVSNPLGDLAVIDLSSIGATLGLWLIFSLVGLAGGSLFFGEIARISLDLKGDHSIQSMLRMFRDTIYLTLSTYVLIAILFIPAVVLIMIVSLISTAFSQLSIIFVSLIMIWLLMPLIFSPHGIYGYGQNVFASAINSIRLVRYFLPGTGIFILMGVLMSQGMDVLWSMPNDASWMVLVGILGHAFITTSLVASSFIYYRGGMRWMNEKMHQLSGKPQVSLTK